MIIKGIRWVYCISVVFDLFLMLLWEDEEWDLVDVVVVRLCIIKGCVYVMEEKFMMVVEGFLGDIWVDFVCYFDEEEEFYVCMLDNEDEFVDVV